LGPLKGLLPNSRRAGSPLLLEHLLLLVFRLPLGFGEGFDAVGGVFEFLSRQQFGDGEDLQAGIAARKVS